MWRGVAAMRLVPAGRSVLRNCTWRQLAGACSLGMLLLLTHGAVAAEDPRKAVKRLSDGRIEVSSRPYPGTDVRMGHAQAIIDAAPNRVLAVVVDYSRYAEFMPHFKVSRVLAQRGPKAIVYLQAGILKDTVTIWAQLKVEASKQHGSTDVIEARMTKGNIEHMTARWELTPLDEKHTLVSFQFLIDPDLPVPSSLVTNENVKASRRAVAALRRRLM